MGLTLRNWQGGIYQFADLLTKRLFIECLLVAHHCAGLQGYSVKKNRLCTCLNRLSLKQGTYQAVYEVAMSTEVSPSQNSFDVTVLMYNFPCQLNWLTENQRFGSMPSMEVSLRVFVEDFGK